MKFQRLPFKAVFGALLILSPVLLCDGLNAQQIDVARIERMPNRPAPYKMRNWKKVASAYDSLVFDFDASGLHLPLIRWNTNTVNYPEHESFGLHSVVGTPHPQSNEAINVLPAVISATLVGIDKSDQNGHNWVLMCEEYFNRRPEENVYLNHPVSNSGHDWWYDTMPNLFFYQLYDLYPNTGDFQYQLTTVADRWLEAVVRMGGSTGPWQRPYMDYRAWSLSTMTPLETGVTQPEAAGAIGWMLYNAYAETGDQKYRIGAEWCLEFLQYWPKNPSYELQLPYGVYAAARMNAELGTSYNVKKMLNWCFEANDNVRNWGATLGNWGGYDCYGLIGEAKYTGYAFIMNGFEMAGALVPMVRYDDRFARAIGKWVLNLANATRLFYPGYLPADHQDSEGWSILHDPNSCIAHEAMRQYGLPSGISPFATGDFIKNGWAPTNLTLYGSSHAGIFGGIIDTTDVSMILQLDLTKTDFFQDDSYPTWLYYNPYDEEKSVTFDAGNGSFDLYDLVSNTFMQYNVSGTASVTIPADAAIVVVAAPAGGSITYDLEKMKINGIVVDYLSGLPVDNHPPRIKSLSAAAEKAVRADTTALFCTAEDRDNDELLFTWSSSGGAVIGGGAEVNWVVPDSSAPYKVSCVVEDGRGGRDSAGVEIEAVDYINRIPEILSLSAGARKIAAGASAGLVCMARDPDGDDLSYTWSAKAGAISGEGANVTWSAPDDQGYYFIRCTVQDGRGGQVTDSTGVVVADFANIGTGVPIAFYPFNGDANDESGFANHGSFRGVSPVADRAGRANSAFYFDGVDDAVSVRSNRLLNCRDEISVSFWLKAAEFFTRESYPLSHGNWENRWKVSVTPGTNCIRWTIKTDAGIVDLDSKTALVRETWTHVTALYGGSNFDIYINGELDNHATFSGKIMTTSIDLTIGQVLPDNTLHNFKGVIDDVRIYDYALSAEEIENIYDKSTHADLETGDLLPSVHWLHQNYPNPFNSRTTIRYQLKQAGHVSIRIYNALGHQVRTLVSRQTAAGVHQVLWDGRDDSGAQVASGLYFYEMTLPDFRDRRKLLILR